MKVNDVVFNKTNKLIGIIIAVKYCNLGTDWDILWENGNISEWPEDLLEVISEAR